jgi:hypothetical protein
MTARDEAIEAMCGAVIVPPMGPAVARYARALDAIPGPVLVRLAIEQGALVLHERRNVIAASPGENHIKQLELYRVVEP